IVRGTGGVSDNALAALTRGRAGHEIPWALDGGQLRVVDNDMETAVNRVARVIRGRAGDGVGGHPESRAGSRVSHGGGKGDRFVDGHIVYPLIVTTAARARAKHKAATCNASPAWYLRAHDCSVIVKRCQATRRDGQVCIDKRILAEEIFGY